jgi:hypothetical protein
MLEGKKAKEGFLQASVPGSGSEALSGATSTSLDYSANFFLRFDHCNRRFGECLRQSGWLSYLNFRLCGGVRPFSHNFRNWFRHEHVSHDGRFFPTFRPRILVLRPAALHFGAPSCDESKCANILTQ